MTNTAEKANNDLSEENAAVFRKCCQRLREILLDAQRDKMFGKTCIRIVLEGGQAKAVERELSGHDKLRDFFK